MFDVNMATRHLVAHVDPGEQITHVPLLTNNEYTDGKIKSAANSRKCQKQIISSRWSRSHVISDKQPHRFLVWPFHFIQSSRLVSSSSHIGSFPQQWIGFPVLSQKVSLLFEHRTILSLEAENRKTCLSFIPGLQLLLIQTRF